MMQGQLTPGGSGRLASRGFSWLNSIGRLAPGVSLMEARAEVSTIAARLLTEYPDGLAHGAQLDSVSNSENNATLLLRPVLVALLVVVILVLLIASANVANLVLSRSLDRTREMGVRISLGAGRWRLIRQLLIEQICLALLAGTLSLVMVFWSQRLLMLLVPPSPYPIQLQVPIAPTVFIYGLLISLATGIVFGLGPALHSTRIDPLLVLGDESSRGSTRHSRGFLRGGLVVAQIALSLILLIGAALLLQSLENVRHLKAGFNYQNVFIASLDLLPQRMDVAEKQRFYAQLQEHLKAVLGIEHVALATEVALRLGASPNQEIQPEGYEAAPEELTMAFFNHISGSYFETLDIPVLQGRTFQASDNLDHPLVTMVNQSLARRYFEDRAVGKSFTVGSRRFEIVGMVTDFKFRSLDLNAPVDPMFFLPLTQSNEDHLTLHLRTELPLGEVSERARHVVRSLDAQLPLFDAQSYAEVLELAALQQRMAGATLGFFGVLALVLSTVGIYGAVSRTIAHRTREIGIRMALGAGQRDILGLVLRQGLRLVVTGACIGVLGAIGVSRLLSNLLMNIEALAPRTYLVTTLGLAIVAMLAAALPAWRSTRLAPLVALRRD